MNANDLNETTTWVTRKEAAAFMRLSPSTLANWASLDSGPAYLRIGRGRVLYRMADIESWMDVQSGRAA